MFSLKRVIYSLTLSGLLIGLSIVLQRFFVIPFGMYRLSLGNLPIIMASLFLGPVYGGVVGAASDFVGSNMIPSGPFLLWPLISSTLYGVLPYFLLWFVKKLNTKMKVPFFYILLGLLFVIMEVLIFTNSSLPYSFDDPQSVAITPLFRVLFTSITAVLLIGFSILFYFIEKKMKTRFETTYTGNLNQLAFAILLMGLLVDALYSSWWKYYTFQIPFLVSVFFHVAIMLILLPFQSVLLTILGDVFAKQSQSIMAPTFIDEEAETKNEEENHKD